MDRDLYSSLVLSTLNDNETYRKLNTDPTIPFMRALEVSLQEGLALGVLTQKEYDYLNIKHPVKPVFHGLPKIHKNSSPPLPH